MGTIPFFKSELIAEKTWMISYAFSDAPYLCYLVEGEDYALLIDTMMGWGNLKEYCQTLTDKKIKLVNTHYHLDHTGGNFHFDSCYICARDIGFFFAESTKTADQKLEMAKQASRPEYRELLAADDNFINECPMPAYPLWDGDVFDLGSGHEIEVVEVGGHSPGSIVLIDHKTRLAFSGDACNGNTLLHIATSLSVEHYLHSLLHLRDHESEFDKMCGGHMYNDPTTIGEAIETAAKVIAGLDDHIESVDMRGRKCCRAAAEKQFLKRVDGKGFNMSYKPDNIYGAEFPKQVIKE